MVVIVWQLDLQLPVQPIPITTKVVSSNPSYGEVNSIKHYAIKFVSDLRTVLSCNLQNRQYNSHKKNGKKKNNGSQKHYTEI